MFAGLVVIEIIKRTPTSIQNFVFGRNVNTPTINLFQAFFGIGQLSLPTRNFARYLLMVFMLFCLIMRTAYQAKMFEFLQKEMRKPEVRSIDEMIENNFTFFCHENLLSSFLRSELPQGFIHNQVNVC